MPITRGFLVGTRSRASLKTKYSLVIGLAGLSRRSLGEGGSESLPKAKNLKIFMDQFFYFSPRILFIDMNAFFASVEQQEDKKLRGKPVIVVPMLADTTCALAASYEAKAFGIKTGTSVMDAKKICPGLLVVQARPRIYMQYHEAICEVLNHYFVNIKVLSVDEMACELSYRQKTVEAITKVAFKIKSHLARELGVCMLCSIGVGPNIFIAKVASDFQKPDGFAIFEGDYTKQLFQYKLTDLPGIASRMALRLAKHRIFTVEDLWGSTPQRLRRAWGSIIGEHWYFMLRGSVEADYGVWGGDINKTVGHSHVLPPSFRTVPGARDILLRLSSKALRRLRRYNQIARCVVIGATYRHYRSYRERYEWSVNRAQHGYANDDLWWLPFIDRLSEEMPVAPEYAPNKVWVCFFDLMHGDQHQLSFFDFADRSKYSKLFSVIDRLNDKAGYYVDVGRVFWLKKEAPFRISFGVQ